MNAKLRQVNIKKFSFTAVLFIGLLGLVGLQGCGSGNSTPAVETQDASGLFKSGTAELNGGATMLDDLRAFVHEGRIIMFSVDGHLLFDGQITDITGDDYTATVDVYEVGVKTQSAISVTGKVTTQSGITGTIAGTGDAAGTFTLTFDPAYNTPVPLSTGPEQPDEWDGILLAEYSFKDDVSKDIGIAFDDGAVKGIGGDIGNSDNSEICSFEGDVTPDNNVNVYTYTVQFPSSIAFNVANCTQIPLDTDFTGFAAVLSETGDFSEFLIAFTSGTQSVFGLLLVQP